MAPAVAPAPVLFGMKIGIIFCCDPNVTRILGWRLYTRNDAPGIQVFIHR